MSKEDLYSVIPFFGKKLIEREQGKNSLKKDVQSKVDTSTNSENELPFDEVISNIVKIKGGVYRAIVKTNAISLSDMDEEDKDVVIDIYSSYISGLTRAHQVYVPSFTMDLRENENRLIKRYEEEDEKVQQWIKDDIEFQRSLVEENDIIDTQFYIVFQADLGTPMKDTEKEFVKAKKILSKQIKFASDELESVGLYIEQLSYEEIGKLYYYSLNPFSVGLQEPDFADNLVAGLTIEGESKNKNKKINRRNIDEDDELEEELVIDKANKKKNKGKSKDYLKDGSLSFKNKIAPYSINDKESGEYIKIGSTYMTVYEIYDYPAHMPKLWAQKLYKFRENIDISIHTVPIKTSEITKALDKAAVEYGSANIDAKSGEKRKATTTMQKKMEKSSEDMDRIIDELDSGGQSLLHFSMYILVKERSLEKLEETCMDFESVAGSMRVLFRKCSDNMKDALISVLPLGLDKLKTTRNMLTKGVANSFPFTNFSFSHKTGFFLGTHKYNQTLVNFDPFELENANGAIMGCSGGGKSATLKKIIKGLITTKDIKVRVVDPEGENIKFAKEIGASIVDYFVGSKDKINVFDLEPDDEIASLLKPQTNFIKIFLNKIMDIEKEDKSKLDYSIIQLYKNFGFTDDKETYWDDTVEEIKEGNKFTVGRRKRRVPELLDLYNMWAENQLFEIIGDTKKLANDLREWTRLGSNDMFDGQTTVDFSNKRIYFNLKHLDKSVKPAAVFVLFQKLWDLVRKDPTEEEAIVNEEVHHLLRDDDMGEYVYELNKRIRKYGGASIYATQNITDFMKTKWGPEIIKNCSWSVLVKQNKKDIEPILECYEMTRSEAVRMTKFNRDKGEAYLIADKFRIPINVRLSDKEMRVFTTKTSDLKRIAKEDMDIA